MGSKKRSYVIDAELRIQEAMAKIEDATGLMAAAKEHLRKAGLDQFAETADRSLNALGTAKTFAIHVLWSIEALGEIEDNLKCRS